MKLRQHRGSLADSMETQIDIEPTKEAVARYISLFWSYERTKPEDIRTEYVGYDDRIMQETYYVLVNGQVFGMSDQEIR